MEIINVNHHHKRHIHLNKYKFGQPDSAEKKSAPHITYNFGNHELFLNAGLIQIIKIVMVCLFWKTMNKRDHNYIVIFKQTICP